MTNAIRRNPATSRLLAVAAGLMLAVLGVVSSNTIASAQTPANPAGIALAGPGVQAVPGSWTLAYDWGCDGSYSTATMTFAANGTWTSSEGYTGPWVNVAGILMFTFDGSETTYSGNIASRSVTGIQTTFAGFNGCFYLLQAGVPTGASVAKAGPDASGKA